MLCTRKLHNPLGSMCLVLLLPECWPQDLALEPLPQPAISASGSRPVPLDLDIVVRVVPDERLGALLEDLVPQGLRAAMTLGRRLPPQEAALGKVGNDLFFNCFNCKFK